MRIDAPANVGVGTTTPQANFCGFWATWDRDMDSRWREFIVTARVSVGIGSAWPGQNLDVNATVRAGAFVVTGHC